MISLYTHTSIYFSMQHTLAVRCRYLIYLHIRQNSVFTKFCILCEILSLNLCVGKIKFCKCSVSLRQSFAYQNFAGNPIQEFFERAAMASSLPPSKCLIFPVLRCRFSNQSKQHLLGKQKRKACSCITHKPVQFIKINKSQI